MLNLFLKIVHKIKVRMSGHQAFPEKFFTHALALKSNSMRTVLATARANDFMGAECASIGEVVHAVQCGFNPAKVVYDSPVKSKVLLSCTF